MFVTASVAFKAAVLFFAAEFASQFVFWVFTEARVQWVESHRVPVVLKRYFHCIRTYPPKPARQLAQATRQWIMVLYLLNVLVRQGALFIISDANLILMEALHMLPHNDAVWIFVWMNMIFRVAEIREWHGVAFNIKIHHVAALVASFTGVILDGPYITVFILSGVLVSDALYSVTRFLLETKQLHLPGAPLITFLTAFSWIPFRIYVFYSMAYTGTRALVEPDFTRFPDTTAGIFLTLALWSLIVLNLFWGIQIVVGCMTFLIAGEETVYKMRRRE